ncbi:hypothetical protein XENOCAPTIV_012209 [Xenoophorus captivus]|uniref:non-specific serine/threonine protein kinase n=1 Tax=Xenoophorus captivus TaxID=1517983 RepID=A0ABV0QRF3_9TELE
MSGYKRMRRQHQKQLIALENKLKAEMDEHRLKLQKEVETQANNAYIELEKLAKRHAVQTEKETTFAFPMSSYTPGQKADFQHSYFFKRCMSSVTPVASLFPCFSQEMNEDHSTPKKEKQERLSKHKENMQHSQAEEEAHLLAQQRVFYERNCRAFKRKVMIKRHDVEQEQIREVWKIYILNTPADQLNVHHAMTVLFIRFIVVF